jgi:arylsulfatase A-like enzyme
MGKRSDLTVSPRREIVLMLLRREEPAVKLARRFGVSEHTRYRWRDEFLAGGEAALASGKGQNGARDTWFFFTADHGEMLGDHELMFKNVFYKGSVLVPNIIRPAGGAPARTVARPVESIDITATVLDIAGAKLPQCQGRSLVPLIHGQGVPREVAYSELAGHQNKGNYCVMAATERYRYLYDKENDLPCELFDLEKDPDELLNLVDEPGHAGLRKDLHRDCVLPFLKT